MELFEYRDIELIAGLLQVLADFVEVLHHPVILHVVLLLRNTQLHDVTLRPKIELADLDIIFSKVLSDFLTVVFTLRFGGGNGEQEGRGVE